MLRKNVEATESDFKIWSILRYFVAFAYLFLNCVTVKDISSI